MSRPRVDQLQTTTFGGFEELVTNLSHAFIELPSSKVDERIDEALKAFGQFAEVDRCFVSRFSSDKKLLRTTHLWTAPGIEHDDWLMNAVLTEEIPWYSARILSGRTLIFKSLDDLPAEGIRAKQYAESVGIRSSAIFPVRVGGDIVGDVGVDTVGRERVWSDELLRQIEVIGLLIGGALARQEAEAEIRGALEFEAAIADISATGANLPSAQTDAWIEAALEKMGLALETELGTLLQCDEKQSSFRVTHEWDDKGLDIQAGFREVDVQTEYPWLFEQLSAGGVIAISQPEELPPEAAAERQTFERFDLRSVVWVPSHVEDSLRGFLAFNSVGVERTWSARVVQRLKLAGEIIFGTLLRNDSRLALERSEARYRESYAEVKRLKRKLERENVYLRDEINLNFNYGQIVGQSPALQAALARVEQVAPTDSTVLLLGDTGTGKELLARAIHGQSKRRDRSMITVNCASLPPTLVEAELFGREKGAYTGALTRQPGRFELADGSTIFLDEIGELPPGLQTNLLRVLEEGEFERLGSTKTLKVDVRVIAATNRDLSEDVKQGRFREDLFYRLNVFPISSPPLRERTEDIPQLVWAFVRQFQKSMGKTIESIPAESMAGLARYSWPGNVRELRNMVERAMIVSPGPNLEIELPEPSDSHTGSRRGLADVEREHIKAVLESVNWRVRGAGGAAEILELKPTTLEARMKKLEIKRPSP